MTIPTLPDNLWKLFLLGGILLVAFAYFEGEKIDNKFADQTASYLSYLDSVQIRHKYLLRQQENLKHRAKIIALKNGVENPLTFNDTIINFDRVVTGDPKAVAASDSINMLFDAYSDGKFELELIDQQMDKREKQWNKVVDESKDYKPQFIAFLTFGFILFFAGYAGITAQQVQQDELIKRQLGEKPIYYRYCQSCARIFSSLRHHGTESNGDKNKAFCIECYENGAFTEPDLTVLRLKAKLRTQIKQLDFIDKLRLNLRLKKLDRWKKQELF